MIELMNETTVEPAVESEPSDEAAVVPVEDESDHLEHPVMVRADDINLKRLDKQSRVHEKHIEDIKKRIANEKNLE